MVLLAINRIGLKESEIRSRKSAIRDQEATDSLQTRLDRFRDQAIARRVGVSVRTFRIDLLIALHCCRQSGQRIRGLDMMIRATAFDLITISRFHLHQSGVRRSVPVFSERSTSLVSTTIISRTLHVARGRVDELFDLGKRDYLVKLVFDLD